MNPADGVVPTLPDHLEIWQESLQWQPLPEQQQLFQAVYAGILSGNQQMNLTRIIESTDFWEKHLWDSLSGVAPWLMPLDPAPPWLSTAAPARVIDIGTGAGFPGLPVAIALPACQVTLLDSTQKKIRFLNALAAEIGLGNTRAVGDRAEFLGHQLSHREQYDLALVRAVGPAATCAEYALPLVRIGGLAVLYRGQWTPEESRSLKSAAKQLGGLLVEVKTLQSPLSRSVRHCVYLQKQNFTKDAYPRPVGIPAKQPLAE